MFTYNKKQTRGTGVKTLLATAVTAALMMAPAVKAVDGSSIVKGHVVAQAGNDLTGATITLKHKSKGLVYTITSNNDGDYLLRNVPVGTYDVTISKEGFEPLVEDESFNEFEVVNDFANFANTSDIILANRMHQELESFIGKVFTRDIFNEG